MRKIIYYSAMAIIVVGCKNNSNSSQKKYNFTANDKVTIEFYEALPEAAALTYINELQKAYQKAPKATYAAYKVSSHLDNTKYQKNPLLLPADDTLLLRTIINNNTQLLLPNTSVVFGKDDYEKSIRAIKLYLVKQDTKIELSKNVVNTTLTKDTQSDRDMLEMTFTPEGRSLFSQLSAIVAAQQGTIAITFNNFVIVAPKVNQKVDSDKLLISGYLDDLNIDSLSQLINYSIKNNK
jgi:preprotein translocase subunit SecD